MPISAGTRFGSYEITAQIGSGGMGEVYRARDPALGRDVAIKVLPASFTSDANRVARFEQEAKTLASLNHANIAHVYGLERTDRGTGLVMELVEGSTLGERIARERLPVDEVLKIATQLAEALEAAHERGIVHRDLKPANVKLTSSGAVKVLDFGIAKAVDPREQSGPGPAALTTPAMTEAGFLLGTAAYMSPEQARGKPVDRRTDIWAFGCVLYEMLTGQPAFLGEDVTTTLARVLQSSADLKALPSDVSAPVRRTLELCLEKDCRRRIADMHDVKLALAGAFAPGTAPPAARPLWRVALPVAAALVLGVVIAGAYFAAERTSTRAAIANVASFDITPRGGMTVMLSSPSAVVSPDGQSIAYVAGGDGRGAAELRLRRLSELESSAIVPAGGPRLSGPFFSPDGTQIGYYTTGADAGTSQLKRVSTQGGPSSTIANIRRFMRGAHWGTDGTIVFATAPGGLWRVPAAGGDPESLTKAPEDAGGHMWPEILPGGKAVLFTIVGASEETSQIAVLSLATGEQRVLVAGGSSPHYSPTGHLIYARAGTLFALPFDLARLEARGDAVPVHEGVVSKGVDGVTEASWSATGSLLYIHRPVADARGRRLAWLDTAGRETLLSTPDRAYTQVVLSRDGTRAAVTIERDASVWMADLTRGTLQRLPADLGSEEPALLFFSPDGRRIAVSVRRTDRHMEVVSVPTDGAGQTEILAKFDVSVTSVVAGQLSPDGRQLVLTVTKETPDVVVVDVGEPTKFRDVVATAATEAAATLSADGRWVAYASDNTGAFEVYLQRFPQGGDVFPVSIGGGGNPLWSPGGRALSYVAIEANRPARMVRAAVEGLDRADTPPTLGPPRDLFPWSYYSVLDGRNHFDMTADGERFLVIRDSALNTGGDQLILVQNWSEELRLRGGPANK